MRPRTLILLVQLFVLVCAAGATGSASSRLPVHDGVGGDFTAQSSHGGELRLSDLRDKVVLLFFGYTSCQDICPATLGHLKALQQRLGPESEHVQVVLVTVDPENDTPEHLHEYLSGFDPGFIGVTGTREEMDQVAKQFMARSENSHGVMLSNQHNSHKSPVEHAYLFAHSQQIYLLDRKTRVRALFFVGSPLEDIRAAVLALLQEPRPAADVEERERVHVEAAHGNVDHGSMKEDSR